MKDLKPVCFVRFNMESECTLPSFSHKWRFKLCFTIIIMRGAPNLTLNPNPDLTPKPNS